MPVKAGYLLLAGGGAVFVWSGIKGKSVSGVFRALIGGEKPGTAANANSIMGVQSSGLPGSVTSGAANASDIPSGSNSQNYLTAAEYLVRNGYSYAAAAGIVGDIAGESGGNPEAVGDQGTSYGLIQEHGSQYAGLVTGNPTKDLQDQLQGIIDYNNAQGAHLVNMLNQLSDPVQAADFYSQYFERPAVLYSDVQQGVANSVYQQLISKSGTGTPGHG